MLFVVTLHHFVCTESILVVENIASRQPSRQSLCCTASAVFQRTTKAIFTPSVHQKSFIIMMP